MRGEEPDRQRRFIRTRRDSNPPRPRRVGYFRRTINNWFTRLAGAAADGTFADQEEMYEADKTSRDYIWNTAGITAWGLVFPLLTVVITQLVGVEDAGEFSMAFVVGLLLMFIGNYGMRAYQVSDRDEDHSFSEYQLSRIITCIAMLLVGLLYCTIRGYESDMFVMSMAVYLYKMIDALADVYEGRLQQMGKLYLAGISQTLRSLAVVVVFSFCLLITRNLIFSSIVMAITATASLVLLTIPLTWFETPRSHKPELASVKSLLVQCFPLFLAFFLFNLIDTMPKFVMEGTLSYDNQLYFNAMYFPAQSVLIGVQLIYRPQLVRMASLWMKKDARKRFDLIVVVIVAVIVLVTLAMIGLMSWIGVPLLGILYGVSFEEFRELSYIMLVAGGVTAIIDFLYSVITVLRQQKEVTKLYLITFGFSLFFPALLVTFTGLPGIVIGYLIIMSILMVLLVWEYLRIRLSIASKVAEDLRDAQRAKRLSGRSPEEREEIEKSELLEKRRAERRAERERRNRQP